MKWALILIISALALNSAKTYASQAQVTLAQYCRQNPSRDLNPSLQDLFDRYPDTNSRAKNTQGFVADLDKVIAQTPYASVLNCRNDLPYQVSFARVEEGPGRMWVQAKYSRDGDMTSITLNFNLAKPTPGTFFDYLHELRHVCQKSDSRALVKHQYQEYAKLTPVEKLYYSNRENAKTDGRPNAAFQLIYDEVRRLNFLGEIESFHYQFLSFRQTLESGSPGLCESTNFRFYTAMERDLSAGVFAQNTISSFMTGIDDDDPAFFVPDSPLVEYYDQSTKSNYRLRELNQEMLKAIAAMGIVYRHPAQETGRLR